MQKRNNKEFRLTVSHYKILQTIAELNKLNKYPTPNGVNNILSGKLDNETKQYMLVKTFGTLISFPGRKLCSYVTNMVRREYITYVYDEKSDAMYLKITTKGEGVVCDYERKHKKEYSKKTKKVKPEIVEIK